MSDDSPQSPSEDSPGRVPTNERSSSKAAGPRPNPRSCVTCRRRKVKCDKNQPCSNCVRAKIDCIFPGPGRAPRKSRKPQDTELLDRLRRLEGVVSGLNAQVEEHEQEAAERERQHSASDVQCPYANGRTNPNTERTASVAVDTSVEGLENRFGRLVVEKGRSRYINNSFWASLNNEVEDLKSILLDPSDGEEDVHDAEEVDNQASQHQGFILGYSSTNVDMAALHPSEQQAREFWDKYKENVDPLVKVLHIPTFEPIFFNAVSHFEGVRKGLEPMLFAIYYGAVTSTTDEECLESWGEDRTTLLQRYRFGLEQALARANFLYCDEIIILQAFIIFLILLRRNDAARKIWTLTGLVVRIAQTLGVHRDGSHFKLPPFEIEMRRRLWWQVCILDARSSEDHGCDPTIVEAQFDTKMPLNVNDIDLQPDMAAFPKERQGFTDMTFCLLRFEVANIFRRILYVPPGPNKCTEFFARLTIADKEHWISECHNRMEEKYLKDCDMTVPLCWVTATLSRLIMSKMWLIVYHPHQRKDGGATLPQETKDKLFITSLENLEYSILLETEARTMKWGWLFRTYVQWHAIAFLLSELCVRTKGEAVERAWRALEATAGRWWFPLNESSETRKGQPGCLWKPLRKLLAKAKAARAKEVALERASLALRNGQLRFPGYPQSLNGLGLPSASVNQPSPENLDKMLRPSAPKLGEAATWQSSWGSTPSAANNGLVNQPSNVNGQPQPQASASRNGFSDGVQGSTDNSGQEFSDLMSYGLDNVLMDVMGGMTTTGAPTDAHTAFNNVAGHLPDTTPSRSQFPATAPHTNGAYGVATAVQATHGTFGDNMFGDLSFEDISPALDQSTESSGVDDGNMDWVTWDSMVAQYGTEGSHTSTNPASQMGLVPWF